MSSREPMWFCHECHAEMRPLMVPDPVCASCHGSFVEKMENTADDPRQFAAATEAGDPPDGGIPPGVDTLFLTLQSLMDRGMGPRNNTSQRSGTGPAVTFEVRGPGGARTLRFGGPNTGGNFGRSRSASPDGVPNMSSFVRPPPLTPFGIPLRGDDLGGDRPNISGALMTQYLMALLGYQDPATLGMPENGRMGDYVFNQEALDEIISQIMENSSAHRPVPAPEETIAKLPREILMEGSATLEQDCAVCKEQFKLQTEDPDEQIVVTLPCKHPFHQPCIIPWLTSSGTCPVCRFALVAQPDHHNPQARMNDTRSRSPPPQATSSSAPSQSQPQSSTANPRTPEPGGLFQSIFSGLSGFAHPHNTNNRPSSPRGSGSRSSRPSSPQSQQRSPPHRRSGSNPSYPNHPSSSPRSNSNNNNGSGNGHLPGGWEDELD
ncbi:hypothetical protein HYPSUDRAFT_33773 [Hypholoma sublateritium FD-334 SS-4]|uniref:RING-type domain-containing protein n=1 Tax=Hypholoma sublateritium (strain FD-334 SS-4) TaxID=945553 RepID=A0A0D2LKT6_HYPSF|nr:hypothetical protein HYPSUDRAFT_33773 [Hypholoma sublateritium FD-334 SS-4]